MDGGVVWVCVWAPYPTSLIVLSDTHEREREREGGRFLGILLAYSLRCSKRSHPARDRTCTKRSHSARGSEIWTLLPLVIAQKKMHLRGIELETSNLECLRCCNNQSSLIVLMTLIHPYSYLIGANRENSMIINHSLVCTIMS
jgi:hypothetical protein